MKINSKAKNAYAVAPNISSDHIEEAIKRYQSKGKHITKVPFGVSTFKLNFSTSNIHVKKKDSKK